MQARDKTLTIKVSERELLEAHALADAADFSVGRYVRQVLAREYLKAFGASEPPAKVTRMGRPRKAGA